MNQKKINKVGFYIQLVIVALIAVCLIVLMRFADVKLNELITSDREGLFIEMDPDSPISEELQEIILEFRPGSYKMIEVYSADFNPMLRLQFKEDETNISEPITNHTELVRFLREHDNGYTSFIVDEKEQHIYFKWTETNTGERCLFMIYTSFPYVNNLWVFHVLCYTILILVIALVIVMALRMHGDQIDHYHDVSQTMRDELIH